MTESDILLSKFDLFLNFLKLNLKFLTFVMLLFNFPPTFNFRVRNQSTGFQRSSSKSTLCNISRDFDNLSAVTIIDKPDDAVLKYNF